MAKIEGVTTDSGIKFDYEVEFVLKDAGTDSVDERREFLGAAQGCYRVFYTGWSFLYKFTDAATAVEFKLRFG